MIRRILKSRVWLLLTAMLIIVTLVTITVRAQEGEQQTVEATVFNAGLPIREKFTWTDRPPLQTEEQKAQLEYWVEHTHLSGPMLGESSAEVAGPTTGTESQLMNKRVRSGQPLAPGDAKMFYRRYLAGIVPDGYNSNVMESSVGVSGRHGFFTGNWFAARTSTGGKIWQWVDPYSGFPDFCCDQIAIYDEARDIFMWLRMGVPNANGENVFKLSVSKKVPDFWWTYTISPTQIAPGWTNSWWDYPHIQLGADNMYMSWNMYNPADTWVRTVMLKIDLDNLAAAGAFSGSYFEVTDWFTFTPVQGAYHIMYWASNWPTEQPQNSRLAIWKWPEDSNIVSWVIRDITPWTATFRGDAVCGNPNWAARYDQRVLTGARYSIYSDGIAENRIPGRKVLGWWWNVAQGGDFSLPYIEGAAFFEDDFTQLSGFIGRPYIWSTFHCFAYPSITPNKRQDLGAVFNYADDTNGWAPNVAYSLADDYATAPPGWTFYTAQLGNALPTDERWGDYNTVREFEPTQKAWVAGAHFIRRPSNCTTCSWPLYFVFGRERDFESYRRWARR